MTLSFKRESVSTECYCSLWRPHLLLFLVFTAFLGVGGGLVLKAFSLMIFGGGANDRVLLLPIYSVAIVFFCYRLFRNTIHADAQAVLFDDVAEFQISELGSTRLTRFDGSYRIYAVKCQALGNEYKDIELAVRADRIPLLSIGERILMFVNHQSASLTLYRPEHRCLLIKRAESAAIHCADRCSNLKIAGYTNEARFMS
jgi:hypothetical protein